MFKTLFCTWFWKIWVSCLNKLDVTALTLSLVILLLRFEIKSLLL